MSAWVLNGKPIRLGQPLKFCVSDTNDLSVPCFYIGDDNGRAVVIPEIYEMRMHVSYRDLEPRGDNADIAENQCYKNSRHGMDEWDMFELITNAWYGKQCYFMGDSGIVYSRLSNKNMTKEDAIEEFLDVIGDNGDY